MTMGPTVVSYSLQLYYFIKKKKDDNSKMKII